MANGKVKWFNNKKGYGFVEVEGGGDVFCHFRDIEGDGYKSLEEGDAVTFEIEDGPKGKKARKILKQQQ